MKNKAKLQSGRMIFLTLLISLAGAMTMAGSAFAQSGVPNPRAAAEVFIAATAAGDAEQIASLYATDAIMLAPGAPLISGRDAIRSVFERNFAAGRNTIAFLTVSADTGSDRAAVYWVWSSQIALSSGATHKMNGRSLVYFRKEGESWLISADMMHVDAAK